MNIRIGTHQLRYRISRPELDRLLADEALTLSLAIGTPHTYRVVTGEGAEPLAFAATDSEWVLTVQRQALHALAAAIPSPEGIEHDLQVGDTSVTLAFEVDLHSKRQA